MMVHYSSIVGLCFSILNLFKFRAFLHVSTCVFYEAQEVALYDNHDELLSLMQQTYV